MSTISQEHAGRGNTAAQNDGRPSRPRSAWSGWLVVFVALMMGVIGLFHLGAGFTALFRQDYFIFLPIIPFWSVVSITLTVISVYAVIHGADVDVLD